MNILEHIKQLIQELKDPKKDCKFYGEDGECLIGCPEEDIKQEENCSFEVHSKCNCYSKLI